MMDRTRSTLLRRRRVEIGNSTKRKGEGFWSKPSKDIKWRVRKIMEKTRMEGKPPVQFQRNIVWKLQTFNGKPKCKGWRLVRGVTTMGKAFYKGLWRRQDTVHPPAHCFSVGLRYN